MSNWKPYYQELAAAICAHEHRQTELIAFLEQLRAQGRTITPLQDENAPGETFLLQEIDPFTVMGVFNRGIKPAERTNIAQAYREYFTVSAPAPTDFTGVPTVHNLRSWFLRFEKKRKPGDVATLWSLFGLAQEPHPFNNSNFMNALNAAFDLPGLNINLTIGLHWVQPGAFLPLDAATRTQRNLTAPKQLTASSYANIVNG